MRDLNGLINTGPSALTAGELRDLKDVAKAIELLEIQLCVLSVQMQYNQSPYSDRAVNLAREVGVIQQSLERALACRN